MVADGGFKSTIVSRAAPGHAMSVIADFSVPADQFALGHLLEVRPGVQIRLESMIPTGQSVIPYFWVRSPDVEAVEDALRESDIVDEVQLVDRVGEETLFRVTWSAEVNGVIGSIQDADSVILGGSGHGDHWSFQLRFPGNDALSTFYRTVVEKGIDLELEGVHNPLESSEPPELQLTDEQREALVVALDEGYFEVPRETTLVELAENLGISDSAVSQRIRRGLTKILSTRLAAG